MQLDSGQLIGRAAIQLLVLLVAFGCKPASTPQPSAGESSIGKSSIGETTAGKTLRVLVIDDQPLAAAIQREWDAQSQDAIQVTSSAADSFGLEAAKQTDVLVFPTAWLGMLAEERAIRPLPNSALRNSTAADEYNWNDILPFVRRQDIRWGMETYAVSFGSPQLLLYYRQDLFQKWNLPIPKTWKQYQAVVEQIKPQLSEASTAEGLVAATIEPLGSDWAARTFLARSAAYARHRSQYSTHFDFASMRPLINTPPYVRALDELMAAYSAMPESATATDPNEVAKFLLEGKAVMGLTWPASTRSVATSKVAIRFADLPGAIDVYQPSDKKWQQRETGIMQVPLLAADGRLGAISRYANDGEFAASFLLWVTDQQQSPRISTRGHHTTLFRESQLSSPRTWVEAELAAAAADYADVVRREQSRTQWLMMPRIPGQRQYISVLDAAIRAALKNQSEAQVVLDDVASAWSTITDQLGLERQRKAYLRDIGIE